MSPTLANCLQVTVAITALVNCTKPLHYKPLKSRVSIVPLKQTWAVLFVALKLNNNYKRAHTCSKAIQPLEQNDTFKLFQKFYDLKIHAV